MKKMKIRLKVILDEHGNGARPFLCKNFQLKKMISNIILSGIFKSTLNY